MESNWQKSDNTTIWPLTPDSPILSLTYFQDYLKNRNMFMPSPSLKTVDSLPMRQHIFNLQEKINLWSFIFFHPLLFTLNSTQIFKLWIICKALHETWFLISPRSLDVFFLLSRMHFSSCNVMSVKDTSDIAFSRKASCSSPQGKLILPHLHFIYMYIVTFGTCLFLTL